MDEKLEMAAVENIFFNHRTVDRELSGSDLATFGQINFKQGAEWQSKQSPWISVEEKLPAENEGVFFVVEWENHSKGYFGGLYVHGYWASHHRIFSSNSQIGKVTHWMPIPPQ